MPLSTQISETFNLRDNRRSVELAGWLYLKQQLGTRNGCNKRLAGTCIEGGIALTAVSVSAYEVNLERPEQGLGEEYNHSQSADSREASNAIPVDGVQGHVPYAAIHTPPLQDTIDARNGKRQPPETWNLSTHKVSHFCAILGLGKKQC